MGSLHEQAKLLGLATFMNNFFYNIIPKGVIRVTGEDSEDYLQSQWSINLKKLPNGGVRYGLRLSTKGKVLADSYFLRINEEEFLLISRECEGKYLLSLLNENIVADEVEFIDETQDWELITFWQEEGGSKQTPSIFIDPVKDQFMLIDDRFYFKDFRAFPSAISILVRKDAQWSLDSNFNFKNRNEFEKLRILNGQVSVPHEIGANDLPQEGKLEVDAVDFDKGCYLGQEVMARIHAMGRVRRQVCPVLLSSSDHPIIPCSLFAGEKKVGVLKSIIQIDEGNSFGMALIHEKGIATLTSEGLRIDGFTNPRLRNL